MNTSQTPIPINSTSVFIQDDIALKINKMKLLTLQSSSTDIQNFFFPNTSGRQLNIHRLTNNLINKHQHSLSHRNKAILKSILKSNQEGQLDPNDLKVLNEPTCFSPASNQDIHQYLDFNQQIDFGQI